jgi:VWFA-related protein
VAFKPAKAPAARGGQQPPNTPPTSPTVLKAQTNLVLVDAVVTDKQGNYVRDLEAKDFKVFEDRKEQKITSFSPPGEANGPANAPAKRPAGPAQRHYMVLFFDNSTLGLADQVYARQAAGKFIDKYASPDRPMAIARFGGSLQIAQNFTTDADRLRAAVSGISSFSAVNPNDVSGSQLAAAGIPQLHGSSMADFGLRDLLLSLRALATSLQPVPGRKAVILFSAGFSVLGSPTFTYELTAAIDACNRANVAIYPVDARGLVAPGGDANRPTSELVNPMFPHLPGELACLFFPPDPDPQKPGGGGGGTGGGGHGGPGGGGTGGTGGGGSGGSGGSGGKGGSGGTGGGGSGGSGGSGGRGGSGGGAGSTGYGPGSNFTQNPMNRPQVLLPHMPGSPVDTQMGLRELALGTGGFWILNTNDFMPGLDKIVRELNEYYLLAYTPPPKTREGACHSINVTVERGLRVRFRSGYCDVAGHDLLAGMEEGASLEQVAASSSPGTIPVSLEAPYFYTAPNTARVDLALSIPGASLGFEKEKHELQSEINILGIAYGEDGSVAARFSDTQKIPLEKAQREEFEKEPFIYRNSFEIAPGKYNLKVVLSTGGQAYAKYAMPLAIEPFDGKHFQLSGMVLSGTMQKISEGHSNLDADIIEGRTPLVVGDFQIFPSPTNRFSKSERIALYAEVFEPVPIQSDAPRVGMSYRIVDAKTNQTVYRAPTTLITRLVRPGNPVIPVAVWLATENLSPGRYRLEVQAGDTIRNVSPVRSVEFDLQ